MPLNTPFEEAIKITPQGSHRYTAELQPDWCIGTGTYLSLSLSLSVMKGTIEQR